MAFSSIACGVYNFPIKQAVKIATSTVINYVKTYKEFDRIIFANIDRDIIEEYNLQLNSI